MRDRVVFGTTAVLLSLALFAALRSVTARIPGDLYAYAEGLFVIPVLAMILAARGWELRRRVGFAVAIIGGLLVGHVLASIGGIQAVAAQGENFGAGVWPSLLTVAYHTFRLTFPLAAFEDIEFGYRLSKRGMRILYCSDALAYHDHYHTIFSFTRRQTGAGVGSSQRLGLRGILGSGAEERNMRARDNRHRPGPVCLMIACGLDRGAPTSANTYQAPGVKRAHFSCDIGFRRQIQNRLGRRPLT